MTERKPETLRRGWTTGACATAALKAALLALLRRERPQEVTITLPRGETPTFVVDELHMGPNWAEAAVIKDAGDDPDVTHEAQIRARVAPGQHGLRFLAGDGVGIVTKPGLPVPVGEPAINPVPRAMMTAVATEITQNPAPELDITISVTGGAALAARTWNPRLGIEGGLSILGTTGIVRPFSCAAWIASIHRGIDVARATGLAHVAGCTGATSERVVQTLYDLPDHAMLDMGDFAGGLLKYLNRHPLAKLTIGGGFGKLTKLAQGARDLHSGRSQVDFAKLARMAGQIGAAPGPVAGSNTAMEALGHAPGLGPAVAAAARVAALEIAPEVEIDVVVIDRAGQIVGRAK